MVLDPNKREDLEPGRMRSTRRKLLEMGFKVEPGDDGKSHRITLPDGRVVTFWPYSGWFAGKRGLGGRGFKNLLEAIQ